jgi:hypothetical protein
MCRLDAIRKAREWVLTTSTAQTQLEKPLSSLMYAEPRYDANELFGLVDPDIRQPMDMMEVILRIIDDSRTSVFKPQFGKGMLTVWARIHGQSLVFSVAMIYTLPDSRRMFDRNNCQSESGHLVQRSRQSDAIHPTLQPKVGSCHPKLSRTWLTKHLHFVAELL